MRYTVALLAAGLLAASLIPKVAQADERCAGLPRQSAFGTVTMVNGHLLRIRREAPAGYMDVERTDNDVWNVDGEELRPGVYAGVWGCLPSGSHEFIAEQVTISSSAATYPDRYRDTDHVIYGRIDEVRPGRILVEGAVRRGVWVETNVTGFATGQTVRAIGRMEPNGEFHASHVSVER